MYEWIGGELSTAVAVLHEVGANPQTSDALLCVHLDRLRPAVAQVLDGLDHRVGGDADGGARSLTIPGLNNGTPYAFDPPAGDRRRHRQIGVGVRAGQPVFDAQRT